MMLKYTPKTFIKNLKVLVSLKTGCPKFTKKLEISCYDNILVYKI